MSELRFLQDLQPDNVTDVVKFLSDSDIQASINLRMFEIIQEFYKKRLDVNIILPKTKEESKKTGLASWVKSALSYVPFVSSDKTYENIDLFNDYLTTDALDYAITEVSIENQFLKEIGGCNEEESLANKLLICIKDTKKKYTLLGSSLEEKYKLLDELEKKIALQQRVINFKGRDEEDEEADIFFL